MQICSVYFTLARDFFLFFRFSAVGQVFTPYYRRKRKKEEERGEKRMEEDGRGDRRARLALRLGRRARGGEKDGEFWQLPPLDRASFG